MSSSSGTFQSDQLILVPACCIVQGGDFRSDHIGEFTGDHDTSAHSAPEPRIVSRGTDLHSVFIGIDSLYLLIEYPHADLYYKWAAISDKYPQADLKQGIPVGDILIRRGAHGYGLSLWEGDARLYITTRVDEELRDTEPKWQGMGALLQLGPQVLRQFGEVWEPKKLYGSIIAQLAGFGVHHPDQYPIRLNRVDLTVDVAGLDLQTLPIQTWQHCWVGATKPRAVYYDAETGQLEGLTVGTSSGNVMFRLYDKVFEARQQRKLEFWRSVWQFTELDELTPVTRFEWAVRCYSANFEGINYLPDLNFESFLKLLNYVSQNWGRLCIPQPGDSNQSRWPLDPLWQQLLNLISAWSFDYDKVASREYVFAPDINYEYLVQLTGWLAGLMARVGIQDDKGGPASLAKSLAYIHERGFTLQDIDDKAQEKWDVMARLLAKRGAVTNG